MNFVESIGSYFRVNVRVFFYYSGSYNPVYSGRTSCWFKIDSASSFTTSNYFFLSIFFKVRSSCTLNLAY